MDKTRNNDDYVEWRKSTGYPVDSLPEDIENLLYASWWGGWDQGYGDGMSADWANT